MPAMPKDEQMIHVRLPRELVRRVDHACVDLGLTRAGTVAKLLESALERLKEETP